LLPQEDFAFAADRARRTQFPRLDVKLKPPEPDAIWDRLFHEKVRLATSVQLGAGPQENLSKRRSVGNPMP